MDRTLGVILFEGFELLDVYGPLEMLGNLPGISIEMTSERGGAVASAQGPKVLADSTLADCPHLDLVLVPGGVGTREQTDNRVMLDWLGERAAAAETVMTVRPCWPGRGFWMDAGLPPTRPGLAGWPTRDRWSSGSRRPVGSRTASLLRPRECRQE